MEERESPSLSITIKEAIGITNNPINANIQTISNMGKRRLTSNFSHKTQNMRFSEEDIRSTLFSL